MISYRGTSGQIWYELERHPDEVVLVQADYRGGTGTDGDQFTLLHPEEFARCGFVSLGEVPEAQAEEIRTLHCRRLTNYQKERSALTVFQRRVLQILSEGDKNGREIRQELYRRGYRKSTVAFYAIAAKLEDAELVVGRYRPKLVEGVTVQERWYSVTEKGRAAIGAANSPTR